MLYHRVTLFLLTFLFVVLSANSASAYGNNGMAKCGKPSTEKSCCAAKKAKKSVKCAKKPACCGQNHVGQKCPGSTSPGGCQCPCAMTAGGHAGAGIEEFPLVLSSLSASSTATLRQAFYYARYMPDAVYLPIWQPPQLAA